MSLTELTIFLKNWFELFFYNTVDFSSAKNKKKKKRKEKTKNRKEK